MFIGLAALPFAAVLPLPDFPAVQTRFSLHTSKQGIIAEANKIDTGCQALSIAHKAKMGLVAVLLSRRKQVCDKQSLCMC